MRTERECKTCDKVPGPQARHGANPPGGLLSLNPFALTHAHYPFALWGSLSILNFYCGESRA